MGRVRRFMSFVCLLLELITWGFVTASLEHFGAGNGISDLNMVHAGWYICDIEDLPGASQVILVLLPLLLFFFFFHLHMSSHILWQSPRTSYVGEHAIESINVNLKFIGIKCYICISLLIVSTARDPDAVPFQSWSKNEWFPPISFAVWLFVTFGLHELIESGPDFF